MPLLQFFSFAGAVLLALLFVADSYLPKPAARHEPQRFYTIRIAADHVGPEAITFSGDPVRFAVADQAVADPSPVADASAEPSGSPRDAMAQLAPASNTPAVEHAKPKRKPVKRRVVRTQEPPDAFVGWTRPTRTAFFFFDFD